MRLTTEQYRKTYPRIYAPARIQFGASTPKKPHFVDVARRALKGTIIELDRLLRRFYRIYEFSSRDECVLRISLARAKQDARLSDADLVRRGDPIGEFHLWNQKLPLICSSDGSNLAWAARYLHGLRRSLEELAIVVTVCGEMSEVRAFRASIALGSQRSLDALVKIACQAGFVRIESAPSLRRATHDFFDNFLMLGLMWVFNPRSLGRQSFFRRRAQLWISRAELLRRYSAESGAKESGTVVDLDAACRAVPLLAERFNGNYVDRVR